VDLFALLPSGLESASIFTITTLIAEYVVKIVAIGVVPEDRKPGSGTAWLLVILFLPVVGIPLFLLIGNPYINRRRQRIQARSNAIMKLGTEDVPDYPVQLEAAMRADPALASIVGMSRRLTSLPMVAGVNHGLSGDYEGNIRRMAAAVDAADDYVFCGIYIMARDATTEVFFAALERAAARGVEVKVLFDHIGSRKYPGFKQLGRSLSAAGIEWHLTLPFIPWRGHLRRIDLRNHRKLLVVDGQRGFMGSLNMIDSSYLLQKNVRVGRHWNDVLVELSGEIVAELEAVFATDWFSESGEEIGIREYRPTQGAEAAMGGQDNALQLIPSGPGYRTEPNLRAFTALINNALDNVRIVSPYFVPDESILAAIVTACYRGVRVELYVSEKADQFMVDYAQSSYYQALLDAGVHIYLFPKPAVLHTKAFTIDDRIAVVGSSNMDMRSFGLNYEISLLAFAGDLVAQTVEIIDGYQAKSRRLMRPEWHHRPYWRRYLESVFRLTSALQ
jgi:cardiolipin synthase